MKRSINSRMLIAASFVLAGFLAITGIILDQSFRHNLDQSMKERMLAQVNVLIASVEEDENGRMAIAYALPETRFFTVGSGLYAVIIKNNGDLVWESPSLEGVEIQLHPGLKWGNHRYDYRLTSAGDAVLIFSLGLTWGESEEVGEGYTFFVIESLARQRQMVKEFRNNLVGTLGGLSVGLLIMLTLILRWGLYPLRQVVDDLSEIEAGERDYLKGEYPKELRGLTSNLNALIATNREHEERYKSSLGDLAHSLKTPLAVLRGTMDQGNQSINSMRQTVEEQVERMDQIVQYQLQRAASSGRRVLTAPIDLSALVRKVLQALSKVYADKDVHSSYMLNVDIEFRGDEGDVMELIGNLLDNAFKWCQHRVEVAVSTGQLADGRQAWVIDVSDDGPGIAPELAAWVLERGFRADEHTSGHGLGLAMVRDIVDLYTGELAIERSALGGASVKVKFSI